MASWLWLVLVLYALLSSDTYRPPRPWLPCIDPLDRPLKSTGQRNSRGFLIYVRAVLAILGTCNSRSASFSDKVL